MDNSFTICFYGSSDYELQRSLAELYNTDIDVIVDKVLNIRSNNLKIITGGYGGIMDLIAEKVQSKKSSFPDKNIEVIGVTCDAYDFENPDDPNYNSSNDYSKHNDIIIQANSFADRIQAMTELSDLFIVLPGKQGSLGELLLTCESYAFGKYILNDKKAKLFVHDFWKPLLINEIFNPQTKIPYFRNFNADVLDYFNIDNIETRLSSLTIQQELNNVEDIPIRDIPIGDYVQSKFIGLKNSINRTVLGRLYDDDMSMTRIRINKDTPMLGLDFGWFLKNPKKPEDGGFYSYSAQTYREYTSEFFASHNSIMLNDYENEFKNTYLNGISCSNNILELSLHNEIPKKDGLKTDGDFNKLKDFFYTKKYGQTLIWKGFRVTQNDYTKKQGEADEILFSIFLLLNHKIPKRKIEKIRQLIDDFLLTVSSAKSGELFQEKQKDIEQAATRAAISQVMARNMSHNIGSHVLSKFKDEKEICDVCITGNKDTQFAGEANFYAGSDYLNKGTHLIAYFNEYLKNRMDFLADIATTDPVMETPMYLFRDILKGFDKNRILLNRISGVSTDRKFKIIVLDKNGNGINILNHSDDPLLSIPNEILGAQAFYILMENIIRNIYKHGNPDKDIEIKIEVKDYEKDASFYELSIYDNIAKANIDAAVTNRNAAFNDSVLDKSKKALRPNNLGTIEMDVCAAYLRCLPIISIEDEQYNLQDDNKTDIPRLIYAYKHQVSDTEFSLGYKLCISKPKEILVVTNDNSTFSINDCKDEKELAKAGIKVVTKDELNKIYNHQILYSLLNSGELENIIAGKQAMLPKRIVYSNEYISLDSAEKFIESVWEQYALRFFDENSHGYHFEWGKIQRIITRKENKISIAQNDKQYSSCENVFIDNHNNEWNTKRKTNESLNLYYDMACSHSKISKFLFNIFEKCNKKLAVEYLEVLNTKIVLLDERIQSNIADPKTGRKYEANETQTPLMEYFEQQKLFIPKQSDCDLNQVSFGTLAESNCENGETVSTDICRYIKGQLTGTEQPDFVIIHLGILEKMLPSDKDKNLKDIDDLIKCLFNNERKRLVVTSGRGKPNNLPDDIPFVPLALVQNAVETLFDKFLLTKILFNARKSV